MQAVNSKGSRNLELKYQAYEGKRFYLDILLLFFIALNYLESQVNFFNHALWLIESTTLSKWIKPYIFSVPSSCPGTSSCATSTVS